MPTNRNHKLYFPNLNGLRFIAAFFVIINHTEQLKYYYQLNEGKISDFAKMIGKLGVMLFFVLSGFLITYLLISEEKITGKIHIKKFYIRRFLRILPLYFLLIILVFFIIQNFSFWEVPNLKSPLHNHFSSILILHLFLFPNMATAIYGFIPYIAQAWSIGTEQQSYFIWPILLKKFNKYRLQLMLSIVVFHFVARVLLSDRFQISIPHRITLLKFWMHFNIDAIAIGSIFAIILFNKHKILKYILHIKFFYFITAITIVLLGTATKIPFAHYASYAVLFGIIITNLAENKKLKNILEGKIISYLGRISYGIYMYHFIVLIPVLMLMSQLKTDSNIIIYSLILTITIAISSISYHYFESFFLKTKTKYAFIKSGKI